MDVLKLAGRCPALNKHTLDQCWGTARFMKGCLDFSLPRWTCWNWHVQLHSSMACNTRNCLLTCLMLPRQAYLTTASQDAASRHGEYWTWTPTDHRLQRTSCIPDEIAESSFLSFGYMRWSAHWKSISLVRDVFARWSLPQYWGNIMKEPECN